MEGSKDKFSSSSSSSILEDLFGREEKSSEIFGSVFPAGSRGVVGRKQKTEGKVRKEQNDTAGSLSKGHAAQNKDKNSEYSGSSTTPCHLSSSLYYGGRDTYSNYPSNQTSSSAQSNGQYRKDGEDDPNNSNMASRGNWWEGSLYY